MVKNYKDLILMIITMTNRKILTCLSKQFMYVFLEILSKYVGKEL